MLLYLINKKLVQIYAFYISKISSLESFFARCNTDGIKCSLIFIPQAKKCF